MNKKKIPVILIISMMVLFAMMFVFTTLPDDEEGAEGYTLTESVTEDPGEDEPENASVTEYRFRNKKLLDQHFEKHGRDMGFATAAEYETAASAVINDPSALCKTEKEDGDLVYYLESTNEFVILSTDGWIRTYFLPDRGRAYYDKQ